MTTQYPNRQFFRKTTNQCPATYFDNKGIELDVDFSQLKDYDAEALQNALNKLPDSK